MPFIQYINHHVVSPSVLKDVITDFEAYTSFIPQVQKIVLHKKGPPEWEVSISIFVIRPLEYRIRFVEEEDYRFSWDLISGCFVVNRGGWQLEPKDDGCLVSYRVEMQLSTYLPSLITRKLQERSIPDLIRSFVDEANHRLSVNAKSDQFDN